MFITPPFLPVIPAASIALGRTIRNSAEDVSLGAAFQLGRSSGQVKQGFNTVKWVGVGLGAVAVITVFGFLKEAVD